MSDLEGFLRRWSRRKRDAAVPAPDDAAVEAPPPEPEGEPARPAASPDAADGAPVFDPASLPPLESITAETDMRAFLAPGVPAELTRAALRRAWVADPQIRDFIGLAENQWDFTASDGMHGFGQLGVEEARALVAEIMGTGGVGPPPAAVAEAPPLPEKAALSTPVAATPAALEAPSAEDAINQQASKSSLDGNQAALKAATKVAESDSKPAVSPQESRTSVLRRTHGRALPE
jgi:hypothetical protein